MADEQKTFSEQVNALATRVAQEIKALKGTLVPKVGNRGTLAGHNVPAVWSGGEQTMTITAESDDSNYTASCGLTVPNNSSECTWIKTVYMTEAVPVTLGDSWAWADGEAPTLTKGLLVLYACRSYGIATFIPAEAS